MRELLAAVGEDPDRDGLRDTPAVTTAALPDRPLDPAVLAGLWELLGEEHVLVDDETRRLRTRGKSTPDLLRARAGDLSDAPDAVVEQTLVGLAGHRSWDRFPSTL